MSKMASHSHLDICSTSYGRKKNRESNCQFDSRPLKVRNWLDLGVCRWSATHRWKILKESYKFAQDLIPIEGLSKKIMNSQSLESPNRDNFGTPPWESKDKKSFRCGCRKEYYMGEGGGFPWIQAAVSFMSPELPVVCPSTKGAPECELTNLLVGLM